MISKDDFEIKLAEFIEIIRRPDDAVETRLLLQNDLQKLFSIRTKMIENNISLEPGRKCKVCKKYKTMPEFRTHGKWHAHMCKECAKPIIHKKYKAKYKRKVATYEECVESLKKCEKKYKRRKATYNECKDIMDKCT